MDLLSIAGTLAITYFLSRAALLILGFLPPSTRIILAHAASFALLAALLALMRANADQLIDYTAAKPYFLPQLFWFAYDYFRSQGTSQFRAA